MEQFWCNTNIGTMDLDASNNDTRTDLRSALATEDHAFPRFQSPGFVAWPTDLYGDLSIPFPVASPESSYMMGYPFTQAYLNQHGRTNNPPHLPMAQTSAATNVPSLMGQELPFTTSGPDPSGVAFSTENRPEVAKSRVSDPRQQVNSPNADLSSPFKCQWRDCPYTGGFSREACLWRHIKSTHLSPAAFKCKCGKTFGLGRKDKFQAHMRVAHMATPMESI